MDVGGDARSWFRSRIDAGLTLDDVSPSPPPLPRAPALQFDWPDGLAPHANLADPARLPSDPLPDADAVVIAWTVAEARALADVLTPGVPASRWTRYDRDLATYLPDIRPGAPASAAKRLGSYCLSDVGGRRVLCIKSELHLNQDGIRRPEGTTLPVAKFLHQIIDEVDPRLVVTTGTAGGTFIEHSLGDVIVTRGAAFRLSKEFANAPFAQASYRSTTRVRRVHLAAAESMMATVAGNLAEPAFGAPAAGYDIPGLGLDVVPGPTHTPRIRVDGAKQPDGEPASAAIPAGHPILSADWFLFGSTTNGLQSEGIGVEMGDAVLGLVIDERRSSGRSTPGWLVVRNLSNPPINGNLPREPADMQSFWSGWYYETFGYWTSVNGALTCWGLVAPPAE